MAAALKSGQGIDWDELYEFQKDQLGRLQRERLVHLLVTLFFALASLLTFGLAVLGGENYVFYVLFLLFFIPAIFYVFHYYFLENTCQRWYKLLDEIWRKKTGK